MTIKTIGRTFSTTCMMASDDRSRDKAIARLNRLATALDDSFRIPGTELRFGLDPILGLLPGIGDGLSALCSAFIIYEAARLGAPKRHLFLMVVNAFTDAAVGTIPFLGDLFDFSFRANRRNLELLESLPHSSFAAPRNPKSVGTLVFVFVASLLSAATIGVGALIYWLFGLIRES
ncbi:MAG: DUF4112 domain-containing protein [Bdellovibrionota bacterium]